MEHMLSAYQCPFFFLGNHRKADWVFGEKTWGSSAAHVTLDMTQPQLQSCVEITVSAFLEELSQDLSA